VGPLGRGGTAWVYAADRGGDRYALKLPDLAQALSVRGEGRLAREARIAAGLNHPGVVRLVESGLHDGRPYLLYELVSGARTLDQAFAGASLAQRVTWVRDVARAVGVAHAHGVVHRDLKPQNVLVDAEGQARVADFGAGWIANDEALTRTGDLVGTPLYLAPEQLVEGSRATSPAVDVWGLGLLLYQALTGAHPFAGAGLSTLLSRAAAGVEPPSHRRAGLPSPLDEVCRRALAPEPQDRFPHGESLAAALDDWLTCAPPSSREHASTQGLPRVPGYRVLEELGAGAAGVVYRARDQALDRDVALKLLSIPSGEEGRRRQERFAVEAQAASRVRHPGLVRIHASGRTETGRPYLVSELIEGRPLTELLGQPGPRSAARLLLPVAQALAALHEADIVHRDVKPANILVDDQGQARLTDFGVARLIEGDDRLTHTGQTLGTPLYMAPEQLGTAREADGRADVYGLGACLYHLIAGVPPAEAPHLVALVDAKNRLPSPPAGAEEGLAEICLRCLAPDPADRYPTARALAEDLSRYLTGDAVEGGARGRRAPSWAIALAVLAVAGAAALAWRVSSAPLQERPAAPTQDPLADALSALLNEGDLARAETILASLPAGSAPHTVLQGSLTALSSDPDAAVRALTGAAARRLEHPALIGLTAVARARAGVQPDPAADLDALARLEPGLGRHPALAEARTRTLQRLGRLDDALASLGPTPPPELATSLLLEKADHLLTRGDVTTAADLLDADHLSPESQLQRVSALATRVAQHVERVLRHAEGAPTTADASWAVELVACLRVQRALQPGFTLETRTVQRLADQLPRWTPGNTEEIRLLHPAFLACVGDASPRLLAHVATLDTPSEPDQAARVLEHLERALPHVDGELADRLRCRRVELLVAVDLNRAHAAASEALAVVQGGPLRDVLFVLRARSANRLGRPQEALDDLAGQSTVEASLEKATALLQLDRPDEAAHAAHAALSTGLVANAHAHGAAHMAWRAFLLGSREPARRALATYVQLSGARTPALVRAAAVHWACGDRAGCLALLERHRRADGASPPAGLLEQLEADAPGADAQLLEWAKAQAKTE
jgi:serine/threonine protein kinase